MTTDLQPIGFDTETHPIRMGQVAPELVCAQAASLSPTGALSTYLYGRQEEEQLWGLVDLILSRKYRVVGQKLSFDLAVLASNKPELITAIFQLLEAELADDISLRQKMLDLAHKGDIEFTTNPDGSRSKVKYNLAFMVKFWFGADISAGKENPDAWRARYHELKHLPVDQWPEDARSYAIDDGVWPVRIWFAQERRRAELAAEIGCDPLASQGLRMIVDFALQLVSCQGINVDPAFVLALEAKYKDLRSLDKMPLLVQHGIIRPGEPPRANALGHKAHVDGCKKSWVETIGGQKVKQTCNCPVKMTAAVDESKDMTKLRAYVEDLAKRDPRVKLKYTAPSDGHPNGQISIDAEFLEDYHAFDPVLTQLQTRNELEKMVTTEIPRMMMKDPKGNSMPGCPAPVVHPRFDVLKETGRTSSYADELVPSINCQNVDPDARGAYVPPPPTPEVPEGYLLYSVDYGQMELGTLAQTCYKIFGHSRLRDLINAGVDLHAWLGAQIAVASDMTFKGWVDSTGAQSRDDWYNLFNGLNKGTPEQQSFYKHYRKLAKPTGLGYPGGLGPETFIAYAKADYGARIDLETAKMLRQVWREALPEMQEYHKWITTNCKDPRNPQVEIKDKETGKPAFVDGFAYRTPMGLYRSAAVYCAAANGIGLQSPSAEGATLGLVNVVRACYDPSLRSILAGDSRGFTTRVSAFIHDELLGPVRNDHHAADRVAEIQKIMEEAMRTVTPDVNVTTQAVLMRRWSKDALPVYDANGRLTVWEPKAK